MHSVEHTTDPNTGAKKERDTSMAVFVHHKNERRKGPLAVPLAQQLVRPLQYLERAARVLGSSEAPSLFLMEKGWAVTPSEQEASHMSTKVLTEIVDHPLCARSVRWACGRRGA